MALKRINADFEHYKVVEFDKFAIKSYNAVHDTDFKTTDIKDVKAEDYPITLAYKYFNDEENDKEVERKMNYR